MMPSLCWLTWRLIRAVAFSYREVFMNNKVSGFLLCSELWSALRFCQQRSIETALKYIKRPIESLDSKSCLISLPTGAGKSGVIAVVAHAAKQSKVLVLCHRRAVCDQLVREINGAFFESLVQNYKGLKKKVFDSVDDTTGSGIYVSTFQKLVSFTSDELAALKKNIDLIIVDEGHSEPSPVWKGLVRGTGAHKVVITATPYRNDLFQFDIDDGSSFIYTFEEALGQAVLMEPDFCVADNNGLIESIELFLKDNPGTKCIVKCKDFSSIEHYYQLLNKHFAVLAVHEQYVNDPRQNVKVDVPANLRDSEYEVIIHQRKLDEGVDIPQAKLLVLTYPVSSGRELVQTIGRIVRLYQDVKPLVVEFGVSANQRMWENYRYFDKSLSTPAAARKFISSLDVNKLIEFYLSSFPDASYYGSRFLRKFDINDFNPENSLVIPTASVCFLNTLQHFDLQAMTDLLYWRANQAGELAKCFEVVGSINVIVSIAFNRSRFLKDQFFFEPSLEVTLLKKLKQNVVAIYDSRGRRFSYDAEMFVGGAVEQSKLLNVMGLGSKTITKEASSRSVGTTSKRPESVSIKGRNLEEIVDLQRNSSYRVATLKCDNFDLLGEKQSSYYVGVDSGRISDQKDGQYMMDELDQWLEAMDDVISADKDISSNLLHSFAKPVPVDLALTIESVIFDFSDLPRPTRIILGGKEMVVDNGFIYIENINGLVLDSRFPELKINVSLCSQEPFVVFESDAVNVYDINGDGAQYGGLLQFLFEHLHKVLLNDGVSYSKGRFYELKLPVEGEFKIASSSLENIVIGIPDLLDDKLDEKGYVEIVKGERKVVQVVGEEFNENSIFCMLDKLKSQSQLNPTLSQLGPFYKYIPDVDLVFCTDMDTEPADFILSSVSKLVYVHVKCGTAKDPQSSAGALAEVGGQAVKNVEMLITGDKNLKAANLNILVSAWPTRNAPQQMAERIRLLRGARFTALDQNAREIAVKEAWDIIAQRRKSSRVQKEIWLVAANSFSASHFENQLNKGHAGSQESLQAYQLIQGWISTAHSNDIDLKIFVST